MSLGQWLRCAISSGQKGIGGNNRLGYISRERISERSDFSVE